MKQISTKGFSLIELLIVISIIGILTTIAAVNFIGVRERARDAQRKTDLVQLQNALELYRVDEGMYPPNLPSCGGNLVNPSNTEIVYMKKTPCDPQQESESYGYIPTNLTYILYSCLENENDKDASATQPPGGSLSCEHSYYIVENP